MIEWIAPAEIGLATSLFLIAFSAATSFLTAAAGIGGGIVLIAVMAVLMPAHALIPVHGAVQIGSNAGRAAIMLGSVQWRVILFFCLGSLAGAALGGVTAVRLPPAVLNIGLACFILWAVWGPKVSPPGRFKVILTGAFSSFLTMFFGATGSFVSAMVKTMKLGRLEHVATHSACMVAQHVIKVFAFGLLGFNYGPYAGLIVAMVASGFVGTVIGKRLLVKMKDATFHRVISVLLSLLALRLFYEGVAIISAS